MVNSRLGFDQYDPLLRGYPFYGAINYLIEVFHSKFQAGIRSVAVHLQPKHSQILFDAKFIENKALFAVYIILSYL